MKQKSRQINFWKWDQKSCLIYRHAQPALYQLFRICWANRSSWWDFSNATFIQELQLLLECSRWYLFTLLNVVLCVVIKLVLTVSFFQSTLCLFEWTQLYILLYDDDECVIYLINFNQFYWCLEKTRLGGIEFSRGILGSLAVLMAILSKRWTQIENWHFVPGIVNFVLSKIIWKPKIRVFLVRMSQYACFDDDH